VSFLLGDLEMAVHVDQMLEAELAREAVGSAEGFGGEPGQVLDVRACAFFCVSVVG